MGNPTYLANTVALRLVPWTPSPELWVWPFTSILQLCAWLPSLWIGVKLRLTLLWYKHCCFSNVNYFVRILTRYWYLSQQGHLQIQRLGNFKYTTVKWPIVREAYKKPRGNLIKGCFPIQAKVINILLVASCSRTQTLGFQIPLRTIFRFCA